MKMAVILFLSSILCFFSLFLIVAFGLRMFFIFLNNIRLSSWGHHAQDPLIILDIFIRKTLEGTFMHWQHGKLLNKEKMKGIFLPFVSIDDVLSATVAIHYFNITF